MFLTAITALAGAADVLPLPTVSAPLRTGLVVFVLVAGTGLTIATDRQSARSFWQMALASTLILMPIVALLTSAARVPFVAVARGSAGPLLLLTFAACLSLMGLWIFAVYQVNERPQDAALLFIPAALLVPAMMGAPGAVDETSALAMLGEASLVGGVIVLLGLLSPESWRPMIGAVALGAQFVLLWSLGRGPAMGVHNGLVVPASAALVLALTVVLTVAAPVGSLFSRRFVQTVEEESGILPATRAPEKGARWQSGR